MKYDFVFMVFDIETTGLSAEKNSVVEIACCPFDMKLNDLPEYYSGVIRPIEGREIQQQALDVTGITRQQLDSGNDGKVIVNDITKYLKSLGKQSNIILVGHNINHFDIPFVVNLFEYHDKDFGKLVNLKFTIDTMHWSRIKNLEQSDYKLGTCCSTENITLTDGHRSLSDTRANKELAKIYLRNLRGEETTATKKTIRPRVKFQF